MSEVRLGALPRRPGLPIQRPRARDPPPRPRRVAIVPAVQGACVVCRAPERSPRSSVAATAIWTRPPPALADRHTIVKDYVRERRLRTREMYVPLSHPPGDAQCDFGQAKAVIGGVEQTIQVRLGALLRAGPSPQRRMLRQSVPRGDDRGVLRRSRLGVLVPGWGAPEHRLRQHETGGGQDPGRRPAPAYSCVL